MLTTSRHPDALHADEYTYKPYHGVLGFMLSCAASIILLRVLLQLFQEDVISEQNMQTAAGLSLLGCLMFYFGTTMFMSFITTHTYKLRITLEGIRYGMAWFPWHKVKAIETPMKRGCYQVRLNLHRRWFTRRWLITNDGLTREMAENLIVSLNESITPCFPALVIGELPPLPQAQVADKTAGQSDAESAS